MNRVVLIFLVLACLLPSVIYSGYAKLKWNASGSAVKRGYPRAKMVTPCFFEGVNVFGQDTLRVAEDNGDGKIEKRVFSFYKKGLVSVELHYRMNGMGLKAFHRDVVAPLNKTFGRENMLHWRCEDKTKESRCFLWCTKEDVVLAVYGHFKNTSPENLDWLKVKHYKRKYFDFRNQRRFCKKWKGVSKLFFR